MARKNSTTTKTHKPPTGSRGTGSTAASETANRQLKELSARLEAEMAQRQRAAERILQLNQELEQRAQELEQANEELEVTNEELRVANEELQSEMAERRHAQEALRVNEERFRFVLANSPVVVANLDRELRYTWVYNPARGFESQDLIGTQVGLAADRADREKMFALLERVVTDGTSAQWESASWTNTGTKTYESHAEPLTDAGGNITGVALLSIDITERKRAEEAMRESESKYRSIVENAAEGIILARPDGIFFYVNPAMAQMLGCSAGEILGKTNSDFQFEDASTPAELRQARQDLAQGKVVHGELRARRQDGSMLWTSYSVTPLFDAAGHHYANLGIHTDITERKRAEEQLRELNQRLTYHVENSPLAVIEWGPDMRLIRWSGEAENVFGWKAEEVLGKRMEDFRWIYKEDEHQVAEVSNDLQSGINPHRFSANRNYRKDGSVAECEWYNSSLLDESGTLRSILSLVLDITARKHAEESLREAMHRIQKLNEDLEQRAGELQVANEELEQLATSLALDLRAPLVSLRSVSRILAQDYGPQLPSKAAELFQLIQADAEEMEDLTQGLLRVMRVTRQSLRKQELSPEESARAAWEELEPERQGREVDLKIGPLPACRADPLLLKQVWTQLLSNALHATRGQVSARIEIGAQTEGKQIAFFVQDNGVGFDMAYAGTIFRAFQRYHHADEWEGSGVGLAIVEGIIRRHGGRVWAESAVGEGATFCFEL